MSLVNPPSPTAAKPLEAPRTLWSPPFLIQETTEAASTLADLVLALKSLRLSYGTFVVGQPAGHRPSRCSKQRVDGGSSPASWPAGAMLAATRRLQRVQVDAPPTASIAKVRF